MTLACMLVLAATAASADTSADQVRAAETAFAKSMADRDSVAFVSHLGDEAVFIGRSALRGKSAVWAGWRRFFLDKEAPFSWAPETVEVLDSGTLGLSSGPVHDPRGERIGTFNSVWRREANGQWKIVFDKGCPPCEPPPGK